MNIFVILGLLVIFNGKLCKAGVQELVVDKQSRVSADIELNSHSSVLPQNRNSFSTNYQVNENSKDRKLDYKNDKPSESEKLLGNHNSYIPPPIEISSHNIMSHQNSKPQQTNDKVNENYNEGKLEGNNFKTESENQLHVNNNVYIPPQIQENIHKSVSHLDANDKMNENYKEHKIVETNSKTDKHETTDKENIHLQNQFAHYQHSVPHAIDDPLPEKVNYVPHIVLDFQPAQQQLKPLFVSAFVPHHLIPKDNIEPPVDKYHAKATCRYDQRGHSIYKTTTQQPYPYVHPSTSVQTTLTTTTEASVEPANYPAENVYDPDIKYPGQIKAFNDKEDIVFINHHHGPKTDFDLFNSHESYTLNLTLPEVIYKAGDDTSFADDLTIIDDYNHTFPPIDEEAQQSANKSKTQAPNKHSATTASSVQAYEETSEESPEQTSDSTLNSEETSHSEHGYAYKKPDIPFDT